MGKPGKLVSGEPRSSPASNKVRQSKMTLTESVAIENANTDAMDFLTVLDTDFDDTYISDDYVPHYQTISHRDGMHVAN